MGFDIPGVKNDPDRIVTLTNPIFKGTTDLQGYLLVNSTLLTSVGADINLLAGMVAASLSPVKVLEKTIVCTTGTAVVTAIGVIPAGSTILNVSTYCSEALNGAVTKTFEVGIGGDTDKYIDPVDCPVTLAGIMDLFLGTNHDQKTPEMCATAMTIQAVHTNTTHAGAVTGKMVVRVVYA